MGQLERGRGIAAALALRLALRPHEPRNEAAALALILRVLGRRGLGGTDGSFRGHARAPLNRF
jgi:hypothetical protein